MRGYILVADLLGFGALIKNLSESEQSAKVSEWVSLVQALCKKHKIEKYQLLSDTLFIGMSENDESLIQLISFSKAIIEEGLSKYFLIRGGISYGQYEWDALTYGKAVISAHKTEVSQKWIGIILDVPVNHLRRAYAEKSIVCYPAPTKSMPLQLHAVVKWTVPIYRELISKMASHNYVKAGEIIPAETIERAHSTALFGLYLRQMAKLGLPHDRFNYSHPFELIESIIST